MEGRDLLDWDATPADHGLAGWAFDPAAVQSNTALSAGQLAMIKVKLPLASLVNNVLVTVAGVGVTLAACFEGVYDSTGQLLGQTADLSAGAAWTTVGTSKSPLTTQLGLRAGVYYVGLLAGAASVTPPSIVRGALASQGNGNANLTPPRLRFGITGAGLSALPAAVDLSALSPNAGALAYWVGLAP